MKEIAMAGIWRRVGVWGVLLGSSLLLAACGSQSLNRAPVEDRGAVSAKPTAGATDPNTPPVNQPPGFENAGKPGYYTVKPGDTLIRIGLDTGQPWRDISRWNNIDKPNQIEVGQVLRVIAPVVGAAPSAATAPASATGVVTRPVTSSGTTPVIGPVTAPVTAPVPAPASSTASPAKPAPDAATGAEDQISWGWPVNGPVLAGFDEVKNKGLDLGGKVGEAVLAAADGRVVYVGAGLRGYGNLIILKHNNTYLTAYAHNQTLLVKEDQSVRKGQKIAEMGSSDADRVKLHFEVRRQGKPVDPAKFLPTR